MHGKVRALAITGSGGLLLKDVTNAVIASTFMRKGGHVVSLGSSPMTTPRQQSGIFWNS